MDACPPADDRLLVTPVRQGQDPALPRQTPVAEIVDEARNLLELGPQHRHATEIAIPLLSPRLDFENHRKHQLSPGSTRTLQLPGTRPGRVRRYTPETSHP